MTCLRKNSKISGILFSDTDFQSCLEEAWKWLSQQFLKRFLSLNKLSQLIKAKVYPEIKLSGEQESFKMILEKFLNT